MKEASDSPAPLPENIPKYVVSPSQAGLYNIHDVVNNHAFIPLEVPENLAIEELQKVIFRDSTIYVMDKNRRGYKGKISVYDMSGSFQFVIDKSGRGPGEYELIHDFDITEDRIIVVSNARILFYDRSTGMHVNTVDNNFENHRVQWAKFFDENSGVSAAGRGRMNRSKHHFKFFETDSNSIISEALPFASHAVQISGSSRFLFETDEGISARPVNSNIVYSIQQKQDSISVEPRYALDFGELWIPESFLSTSFQNMDQIFTEGLYRDYVHTVDLFETKNIIYGSYTYDGEDFTFIHDKETDQHINISEFTQNKIGWPAQPLGTSKERIAGVTYPFEMESQDAEIDPTLREIIENSDNEGKPILVLVGFDLN